MELPEPLLTTEQVATWLAVSVYTVRGYVRSEKLPFVALQKKERSILRFKREEVQRWIDERSGRNDPEHEEQWRREVAMKFWGWDGKVRAILPRD